MFLQILEGLIFPYGLYQWAFLTSFDLISCPAILKKNIWTKYTQCKRPDASMTRATYETAYSMNLLLIKSNIQLAALTWEVSWPSVMTNLKTIKMKARRTWEKVDIYFGRLLTIMDEETYNIMAIPFARKISLRTEGRLSTSAPLTADPIMLARKITRKVRNCRPTMKRSMLSPLWTNSVFFKVNGWLSAYFDFWTCCL